MTLMTITGQAKLHILSCTDESAKDGASRSGARTDLMQDGTLAGLYRPHVTLLCKGRAGCSVTQAHNAAGSGAVGGTWSCPNAGSSNIPAVQQWAAASCSASQGGCKAVHTNLMHVRWSVHPMYWASISGRHP